MAATHPYADVVVTGATGMIGAAAVRVLRGAGLRVREAVRSGSGQNVVEMGELSHATALDRVVANARVVVHCAAIAHRAPPGDLDAINVRAAIALAEAAAREGVERFVFVSSIKAAAERSLGAPLRERDPPMPSSPYGLAKRKAEAGILEIAAIRPVCLRPPLVHAPWAKANFARLLRFAASPIPAPVLGVSNRRSMISLDTMAEAIATVAQRFDGPGGTYFVADDRPVSLSDLITALRDGIGRAHNLWPSLGLDRIFRNVGPFRQLFGSLEADDTLFSRTYGYPSRRDTRAELIRTAYEWSCRQ